MTTTNGITLSAFITNLGKYNEGFLIGEWVQFPVSDEELEAVFQRIGISSEPDANGLIYEEYFITDYECELDLGFGEYTSIDTLNEAAEALEGLSEYDCNLVKALLEAGICDNVQDALEEIDTVNFYPNMSLLDVAYEIIDNCYPEIADGDSILSRYFDYEAYARDLGFDGFTETSYGTIEQ